MTIYHELNSIKPPHMNVSTTSGITFTTNFAKFGYNRMEAAIINLSRTNMSDTQRMTT